MDNVFSGTAQFVAWRATRQLAHILSASLPYLGTFPWRPHASLESRKLKARSPEQGHFARYGKRKWGGMEGTYRLDLCLWSRRACSVFGDQKNGVAISDPKFQRRKGTAHDDGAITAKQ